MTAPTMPADCRVETLRVWVNALADCDLPDRECRSCLATARAVRALVERKVREACEATDARFTQGPMMVNPGESIESIVSRVLGAP